MDYKTCVQYIENIPLYGKKSGLNNIIELLKRLGNPEKDLRFIHVAGTNGKGSVCTMLASIYEASGLKVGLFTSPHLVVINERIGINGQLISDHDFCEIGSQIIRICQDMADEGLNHPTFFEVIFAICMVYFKGSNVDLVILETGVGGRLDATNSIPSPLAVVITQIGFDHVLYLGDTIEKIAAEKGGIIKEHSPVILQDERSEVKNVIEAICVEKEGSLHNIHPYEVQIIKKMHKSIDFSINSKYYNYDGLRMYCSANYQIINIATALTTVSVLQNIIPVDVYSIRTGVENFYWPARMEILGNSILIDGAHNIDGIYAFIDTIEENFSDFELTLVLAVMKDKAYDEMVQALIQCKQIRRIILTQIHEPRGLAAEDLLVSFQKNGVHQVVIEKDLHEILAHYKPDENNQLLCFLGSLYLAGAVKKILSEDTDND